MEHHPGPCTTTHRLLDGALHTVGQRSAAQAAAPRAAALAIVMGVFSKSPSDSVTAISIPDSLNESELRKTLRDTYGMHLAGGQDHLKGKIIRMSHMGYVDVIDTLGAIAAIEQAAHRLRHAFDLGAGLTLSDQANADLRRQVALTEAANEDLNGRVEVLQAQVDENLAEVVQAEIEDLKNQRDALVAKVNQLSALTEEYLSDPKVEIESSGLACTGSMLPLLHCGDMVIMQTNLKRRDVQVGDIISFRHRDCFTGRSVTDSITLHRVVGIDAGWFVTQGDNNYTVDSCRLPLNNVTGKLLAYIEDIYPEHYMGTANYEAIKTNFNELQELFNRDLSIFREQEERLEDAEDEYNDGRISYSRYVDVWEDTRDDRISLLGLLAKRDDLADTFFGLQDLIIQRNYDDADWAHLVN